MERQVILKPIQKNACRNCGHLVDDGVIVCPQCTEVVEQDADKPNCFVIDDDGPFPRLVSAASRICRGCGYTAAPIVAVCPKCSQVFGNQLSTPATIGEKAYTLSAVDDSQEVSVALPDSYDTTISNGELGRLILALILIFSIIAAIAHFVR